MSLALELPQCPICQDLFVASQKQVVPSRCGKTPSPLVSSRMRELTMKHLPGHALCGSCAKTHFNSVTKPKTCPLCRAQSTSADLIQIYISFGKHEVLSALSSKSSDKSFESDSTEVVLPYRSNLVQRGERAIERMQRLAQADLLSWRKTPTGEAAYWAALTSAGRFLQDLGAAVCGGDELKARRHYE